MDVLGGEANRSAIESPEVCDEEAILLNIRVCGFENM
jgi:hypothetical protein